MSPYERLIEEGKRDRRIANWLTALLLVLVSAAVLAVCLLYHPERAGAACSAHRHPCKAHAASYNHVDVCKSTLRGYYSDDDIHTFGVAIGAKSFAGWGAYGHYSDGSVWINAQFNLTGYSPWYKGRCSGGDYAADWFTGW